MEEKIINLLRCPKTDSRLELSKNKDYLHDLSGTNSYPINNGIINFFDFNRINDS